MNYDINFRFVTRTLKEDYRVYINSGKEILSDPLEFAPIRKKCGIFSEDGGCAVLFEDVNKIFLIVSGLQSGREDFAGRTIRFSFCRIFQNADKIEAYKSFIRAITQWENMQIEIQSLFQEQNNNIFFDEKAFINWLQDMSLPRNNFEICQHGDVRRLYDVIWPSQNCMLKWLLSENDEIFCRKILSF